MGEDYHKILRISGRATHEDVKRAYRKLAREYHPDKNKSVEAEEKFKEIAKAYEVLSARKERRHVSKRHCRRVRAEILLFRAHCRLDNMNKMLDAVYEAFLKCIQPSTRMFAGLRGNFARRPADPVHFLPVSLEEVYYGCVKRLRITNTVMDVSGCISEKKKVLDVEIKRGCQMQTKIVFPGAGNQIGFAAPSDIIVIVKIKEHPLFTRSGNDLRYKVKLTLIESLYGRNPIEVPTITGESFVLERDKMIKPSTIGRIRGKGLPYLHQPSKRGDLIVEFDVRIPENFTDLVNEILAILHHNRCNTVL